MGTGPPAETQLCCSGREQTPRHVGDHKAGTDIHEHLHHQDSPVVFHTEDGKHCGQKRGISRQPDVRRRNLVRTAQAVDPMLQPVFGDVTVNEGIGGDAGKRKMKSNRSPNAASVANRKNRRCWRTSWRTLRIYLSADVARAKTESIAPRTQEVTDRDCLPDLGVRGKSEAYRVLHRIDRPYTSA